jgi:hypothetical protein
MTRNRSRSRKCPTSSITESTLLQLQVRRYPGGRWLLTGAPTCRVIEGGELAECLDRAERECGSAPAMIEIVVDGLYIAVWQPEGWPKRLCRSATCD